MSLFLMDTTVKQIKGVSDAKEQALSSLGINSILDLLFYFPFRYEDMRVRRVADLVDGERATLIGQICTIPHLRMYGPKKSRLSCKIEVEGLIISATWFNRHFLRDKLTIGKQIMITGKWEKFKQQMVVAESDFPDERGDQPEATMQPIYGLVAGVTQQWLRRLIHKSIDQYGKSLGELLPNELLEKHRLMPRLLAVQTLHAFPSGEHSLDAARKRMVYEELLLFQIKLQAYRQLNIQRQDGIAHVVSADKIRAFASTLPFELTKGQKQAVNEILIDMRKPFAMNRLLQGDVGSGKTVVAAIVLYAAACAGHQGALMVPTEILAEQHMRSLQRLLEPMGMQVALLTGSTSTRNRRDILAGLQMGQIDLLVGTHALIQEDVWFRSLGLVVMDEQHRFGVGQRSILRRKGQNPDVLTMTATPIPRTLAITAFGDMDVSTLRERPAGRKPIQTDWLRSNALHAAIEMIVREVQAGRQAYVICPLIEESEKLDVQNAIEMHMDLQDQLPDMRIGLLHGRLASAEKDGVMHAFASNETQVLVATTVVEVGVDVPNATLMIIIDADRFGLSQLHQLRGRVGRGDAQSYCVLISDPKSAVGRERMKIMTETDDGFEVARRDLALRGPGDFFGTKQSGLPEFRLADITEDYEWLEWAREDAAELVNQPDFWRNPAYQELAQVLKRDPILQGEQLD